MLYVVLTLATLATSFVSGVLSMAGGMILMGVFSFFLSVPAAMVLHGIAQSISNGSRIWLYRHHIRWSVLIPYSIGAFATAGLFTWVTLVPDKSLVFLLVGSFPFLALWLPKTIDLDMEKPAIALVCGLLVTTAQMLAGASGPVLDIFYIKSNLSRHEILGTKAITQTLGHILKLIYYAFFLGLGLTLPLAVYPAVIIAAIVGNWFGSLIVEKIDDQLFKAIGRRIIMLIGIIYIGKGLSELFF